MIYRFILAIVLLLSLIAPELAPAYELATHARITQAAINNSVLNDPQFLADLGLDAGAVNPFGDVYSIVISKLPLLMKLSSGRLGSVVRGHRIKKRPFKLSSNQRLVCSTYQT